MRNQLLAEVKRQEVKHEIERLFTPDSSTVVMRWSISWQDAELDVLEKLMFSTVQESALEKESMKKAADGGDETYDGEPSIESIRDQLDEAVSLLMKVKNEIPNNQKCAPPPAE